MRTTACLLLSTILVAMLSSCASPRVAPRFDVPSTTEIGKGISNARKHIESANDKAKKIFLAEKDQTIKLQVISLQVDLDNALKELSTTEGARKQLDAKLKTQTEKANTLADQYDKAHATIKAQEEIIKQVNSHWGLGAFAYGFKVLVHHLLVLAVVVVILLASVYAISLAFPAVGAGLSLGSRVIVAAINRVKSAIQKRGSS